MIKEIEGTLGIFLGIVPMRFQESDFGSLNFGGQTEEKIEQKIDIRSKPSHRYRCYRACID
jgi:hypothetical protein